jgi:hypothetical protein
LFAIEDLSKQGLATGLRSHTELRPQISHDPYLNRIVFLGFGPAAANRFAPAGPVKIQIRRKTMIPSKAWFPGSLAERAAWYQNFSVQFAALADELGFDPMEVGTVEADNTAFQFLASIALAVESYESSMRAYRKEILEGDHGKPGVELPLPPTYPATPPTVDPGIFERLANLVERIRVAPNFTAEDGTALNIVPSKPANIVPNELQPNPSLEALPGNVVEVRFIRGQTDGIEIQYQLDKDGEWVNAGRFLKSPAVLDLPQNVQGTARSVQIRARYVLDNSPVGQFSDTDNISTIP